MTVGPKLMKQATGSFSSASVGKGPDLSQAKNLRVKGGFGVSIGSISVHQMNSDGEEESE